MCVSGSRGLGRNQVICLHLARRGGASERETGGPDVGENSEWVMTRGVGRGAVERACVMPVDNKAQSRGVCGLAGCQIECITPGDE